MFKEFYNTKEILIIEDNEDYTIGMDLFLAEDSALEFEGYSLMEALPCYNQVDNNQFYKLCGSADYNVKRRRSGSEKREEGAIKNDDVKQLMRRLYPHLRKAIQRKDLTPDDRAKNKAQIRSLLEDFSVAFAVDSQDKKLFLNILSVVPRAKDYSASKNTNVAWVEDEDGKIQREKLTAISQKGRIDYQRKHGKGYDTVK